MHDEESRPAGKRWAQRMTFDTKPHAFALALAEARGSGRRLLDLTDSNPTRCGFEYDAESLLRPLMDPDILLYEAHPMGTLPARTAIAHMYYERHGVTISPERLFLTTSTSEAYGYLFRLLCDPGDEVLVPQPSYPLFDLLARMEDVTLRPYPLLLHDGWHIDFGALEAQLTPQTRAIVVVHPNNPTGHFVDSADRTQLERIARECNLVLIVDEVFLDYDLSGKSPTSFTRGESHALSFVLSGLSKVAALPQMKLAWTAVCGPEQMCAEAIARLEFIADTYLSVQAPVQHALPSWLALAPAIQEQLRERCRANLATLDRMLAETSLLSRPQVDGGWSVLLRCPAIEPDEELALRLLRRGVVVHPGSFYGLPGRGWIALSLLVAIETFEAGLTEIVSLIEQAQADEPRLIISVEDNSSEA